MIEVIKYRDIIPVTAIPRFVSGMESATLEVTGEDFSSVEKVFVNDILVKEFMVINKNTMWIVLPDAALGGISTIEVISGDFTRTAAASKISFEFGTHTRKISGMLKLVQLFTKWLLTTPGTDIFNPRSGGGVLSLIGKIATTRNMDSVITSITQAVNNTAEQIRVVQTRVPRLPPDERLLSADLVDYAVAEDRMEAQVRIQLRSFSGDAAVSNISL